MATSVVGLFDQWSDAANAVEDLVKAGVDRARISIVSAQEQLAKLDLGDERASQAGESAASGLSAGALIGGTLGLLAGVGAVVLPLGLAVAGPVAGLLAGTSAGAATGGIVGALLGLGIPSDRAEAYAESVKRGGVLISVDAGADEADAVESILDRDGAIDIEERQRSLREEGWTRFEEGLPGLSQDGWRSTFAEQQSAVERERDEMERTRSRIARYVRQEPAAQEADIPDGRIEVNAEDDFARYEGIFQGDFRDRYAARGEYALMEPAYRFGFEAAKREQFQGHDWSTAEDTLRQEWEGQRPGTWDEYREAILTGWNRCHLRETSSGPEML